MINKGNFSEKVLNLGIKGMSRWEQGEHLDMILDDYREKDESPVVADLLFNYFRHKAIIDYAIFSATAKKAQKTPKKFLRIISLALTQVKFQQGIEDFVAVDVAVGVAKKKYGARIAGFINAVLRKLVQEDFSQLNSKAPSHVQSSLPKMVFERWIKDFGEEQIAKFAECMQNKPDFTFRLTGDIPDKELKKLGCKPIKMPSLGAKFYFASEPGKIFEQDWLEKGLIYIQDISTLSPTLLYQGREGDFVLDLCAAPGGKSLLLREKMNSGLLIAGDSSLKRQQRTIANLRRFPEGIAFVVASALNPPFKPGIADCVLLDVPCSNTGVFRRRPDALWNFTQKKLKELTAIQAEILVKVAELVKSGGSIIYSTCSIECEENQKQVVDFLAEFPDFSLEKEEPMIPNSVHDGGYSALIRKK